MSGDLQLFAFEDNLVRVVMRDDDPWFVAKDVCRVLGIANHRDACERLDDDERDGVGLTDAIGRDQDNLIISESGLYTIVLRSRAATTPGSVAHRFRKWVTADVLPAIRRTGRYESPLPAPVIDEGDDSGPLGPLSEISVRARLVEIAERLSGKPAARALWRRLGLPWVDEMEDGTTIIRPEEDDAIARFAIEGVERAPGIATPSPVLWRAFAAFCVNADLTNPGEGAFYRRFGRMGYSRGKSRGNRVYHGIRPAGVGRAELGG